MNKPNWKRWLCRFLLGHTWKPRSLDDVLADIQAKKKLEVVYCERCGSFQP